MKTIPFTQFMLPDGREQKANFRVTNHQAAAQANEMLESGRYRFECEVLTTGQVSLSCADLEEEDDIAIEVVENGPGVVDGVHRMIQAAYQHYLRESA